MSVKAASNPVQFDLFGNPVERGGRKERREIIKLDFEDRRVRVVIKNGEPWWVLSDLAKILGYRDAEQAKRLLRAKHLGTTSNGTPGIQDGVIIVSEPGLYRLMMRSNQPNAERFQDWVTEEVLPQIRKTGGYALSRTARIARKNKCDLDTAQVRGDQIDTNKRLHGRLYESGASPRDFAAWHNGAYRGQFERTAGELRDVLNLPSHATPLDRMERVPLTCNLHAKVIAEKIIEEREKEGKPIPLAEQPALVERIARKMAKSDLNRIGEDYQYGLIDHPRRGLVIDVIKALPA